MKINIFIILIVLTTGCALTEKLRMPASDEASQVFFLKKKFDKFVKGPTLGDGNDPLFYQTIFDSIDKTGENSFLKTALLVHANFSSSFSHVINNKNQVCRGLIKTGIKSVDIIRQDIFYSVRDCNRMRRGQKGNYSFAAKQWSKRFQIPGLFRLSLKWHYDGILGEDYSFLDLDKYMSYSTNYFKKMHISFNRKLKKIEMTSPTCHKKITSSNKGKVLAFIKHVDLGPYYLRNICKMDNKENDFSEEAKATLENAYEEVITGSNILFDNLSSKQKEDYLSFMSGI